MADGLGHSLCTRDVEIEFQYVLRNYPVYAFCKQKGEEKHVMRKIGAS